MLFASAATGNSGNGGNFLIPNGTFVVELVIFLVVLGIIAKWILPPLQKVAETRRVRISTALQNAEATRAESQSLLAERDRVLIEARARPVSSSTTPIKALTWHSNTAQRGQEEYERLVGASRDEMQMRAAEPGRSSSGVSTHSWWPRPSAVLGSRVDLTGNRALIDEAIATATATSAGGD